MIRNSNCKKFMTKNRSCKFIFIFKKREEKEENGHRVVVHDIHDRRWMLCAFVSEPQLLGRDACFPPDAVCVLLWWMSTLTETIIQLRLPLFAARWRCEVDRYVARARAYSVCIQPIILISIERYTIESHS